MESTSAVVERVSETLVKPVVYGNYAEKLPHSLPNKHTHKWKMFVRPFFEEDMSKYVRKVQFRLHESYANPLRTIEAPPFEIEETGWGEFEATIKIFFVDSNEKPITAVYYLRLFHPVVTTPEGKQVVLYEHYDEIIFVDPTIHISKALKENAGKTMIKTPTDFVNDKARTLDTINTALSEVNAEIEELRNSLRQLAQQQLNSNKSE